MSSVVIDASVLIKLYIDEVASSEAEHAVQAADELLSPDLVLAETANILWKYVRRGDVPATVADELLGDILQMPILITASRDLIEPALRIALETDRTVYDSLYTALAVQTETIVLTADQRLVNSLEATTYGGHVKLVGSVG